MENDLICFREDLVKRYSQGRKNVSEKETDDLLRCFLEYLSKDMLKTDGYAYKFPSYLGKLYKPTNIHELEDEYGERDIRMLDVYYLSHKHLRLYHDKHPTEEYDKMELQRNQNAE